MRDSLDRETEYGTCYQPETVEILRRFANFRKYHSVIRSRRLPRQFHPQPSGKRCRQDIAATVYAIVWCPSISSISEVYEFEGSSLHRLEFCLHSSIG